MHRLPAEEARRKIWIYRIGRKDWVPNANSRLCEDHFTEDQYGQNRLDGRKLLKKTALPTKFSHRPQPKSRRILVRDQVPATSKRFCVDASIDDNALELQDMFLKEKGFKFVLLGRLSQDALENLFSMIRLNNPVPSPKSFKHALRLISVSQFFQPVNPGSYEPDDNKFLMDFIKDVEKERLLQHKIPEDAEKENCEDEEFLNTPDASSAITKDEEQSLYYLCGRTVKQAKKRYRLCENCETFLTNSEANLEVNRLTQLKSYGLENADKMYLVHASKEVFELLQRAEEMFRKSEQNILQGNVTFEELLQKSSSLPNNLNFPQCHDVGLKLLKIYFTSRLYFLVRKVNSTRKMLNSQGPKCGSRSVGMQKAVDNLK